VFDDIKDWTNLSTEELLSRHRIAQHSLLCVTENVRISE